MDEAVGWIELRVCRKNRRSIKTVKKWRLAKWEVVGVMGIRYRVNDGYFSMFSFLVGWGPTVEASVPYV